MGSSSTQLTERYRGVQGLSTKFKDSSSEGCSYQQSTSEILDNPACLIEYVEYVKIAQNVGLIHVHNDEILNIFTL